MFLFLLIQVARGSRLFAFENSLGLGTQGPRDSGAAGPRGLGAQEGGGG